MIDTVSTGLLASGTTMLGYHEGWSGVRARRPACGYDIALAGKDWLSVAGDSRLRL